jgi:branched-chain amino acid transport system permease protein
MIARLAPLVVIALLAAVPLVFGEFYINLASQMVIAAIFALSLNLLVGYAGLTSLGHAAFLGTAAYASAYATTRLGFGILPAALFALALTTVTAAFFGLIALRATGLGFMMITLALSQVLWGLAYRWAAITGGDNGIGGIARPQVFGLPLDTAGAFYWFTLVVFVIAFALIGIFAASAFGAGLRGTRDQPRRMSALGHNVWLVRWITFIYAGFWAGVAGLLYVYYNKFIHPTALSITGSTEGLLATIAGGAGTMLGPVVGAGILVLLKNYASSYIERWNMLLGFIFVLIVLFMPDGLVPGSRRLMKRLGGKR